MKKALLASAIVLMMGFLFATPSTAEEDVEALIRGLDQQMEDAINARDLDRLLLLLTPDFVFHFMNQPPIEGKEEFRKFMGGVLIPNRKVKIRTLKVEHVGDLAVVLGEMNIITPGKDGIPDERPGKLLNVWKRGSDGAWRLAIHAPSPNGSCAR
jgi:uncharacterized protein (TIGR02246 family)